MKNNKENSKSGSSKQVKRTPPNPTGKGGFGDNPQNINRNGAWRKQDTPRGKLEALLKDMTIEELLIARDMEAMDTNRDGKVGDIASALRIGAMFDYDPVTGKITLNVSAHDSLLYLVYGSKSENETTLKGEEGIPLINGFVIPTLPDGFIDKDITKQMKEQGIDKLPD